MKLQSLMKNIKFSSSVTQADLNCINISKVYDNSQEATANSLFIAIKGLAVNGHDYFGNAIDNGAAVIVGEKDIDIQNKIPYLKVDNAREALSLISSNLYGNPSTKMKMVGVTGTDGKTTTCYMAHAVLNNLSKCGLTTSVKALVGNKEFDTGLHTSTLEPLELQKLLAKMVDEGCEYCVVEVTSHGIDQSRVFGIDFEVAAITNITEEHLDYHRTLDEYTNVKGSIAKQSNIVFVHDDCQQCDKIRNQYANIKTIKPDSNIPKEVEKHLSEYFPGAYNIQNFKTAYAICSELDISKESIFTGVKKLKSIEGRFNKYRTNKGADVIIDFAHTPNGLDSFLNCVSKQYNAITCVFGCAGERDRQKRPKMGKIAEKYCRNIVLTSEDPRTEDAKKIIQEIREGIKIDNNVVEIVDREEAIKYSLNELLETSDVVVITGKGHEKSMCIGTVEYPWSDAAVVESLLNRV